MDTTRQAYLTTQQAPTNPSPTHFGHAQRTHHTPEPHQTWRGGLARPREGGDWVWGSAGPHKRDQPPTPTPSPLVTTPTLDFDRTPPHHFSHAQHTHHTPRGPQNLAWRLGGSVGGWWVSLGGSVPSRGKPATPRPRFSPQPIRRASHWWSVTQGQAKAKACNKTQGTPFPWGLLACATPSSSKVLVRFC